MGVKIREKTGRLYLDIYWNGRRTWEALKINVGSDPQTKREAYRLADKIRAKREFQLVSGEHGLLDPVSAKRPLASYAEEIASEMDTKNPIPKSLPYIRKFDPDIRLGAINEAWLDRYKKFLKSESSLGASTAAKYYAAIVQILRRAVRDQLIPRNPSDNVDG